MKPSTKKPVKVYLAMRRGHTGADLHSLAVLLFTREVLVQNGVLVRLGCLGDAAMVQDCNAYGPDLALVIGAEDGGADLAVYHQVSPCWERYRLSYLAACGIIGQSRRYRKLHNRPAQAGYRLVWLGRLETAAVYLQLGAKPGMAPDLPDLQDQGRACGQAILEQLGVPYKRPQYPLVMREQAVLTAKEGLFAQLGEKEV